MEKNSNVKQRTFTLTITLLTALAFSLSSCNIFYRLTHKRHPLPTSFTDTLISIKTNLESKDQSIFYSSFNGNCFGPIYSGRATVKWVESDKSYCRTIFKNIKDKKVTDLTIECDIDNIFQEFKTKRLDTVTTFPEGYMFIDPATMDYIKIKNNKLTYERSFEQMPFITSKDTTHILYSFIKALME